MKTDTNVAVLSGRSLERAAQVSVVLVGLVAAVFVLDVAQAVLAPISLAFVIGLMFGPLAERIEKFGISPILSGVAIVALLLILIAMFFAGFAVPLSDWIDRLPLIWARIQAELTNWQGAFKSISNLQDQLSNLGGEESGISVEVKDSPSVGEVALLAPTIAGQIAIFLASLYFFIATRHAIQQSILSLFKSRRMRARVSRMFRHLEASVSRYLLQITSINFALGVSVALALWTAGVPSPLLWGMLAFALNYVIYVGPAAMIAILTFVGLATAETGWGILVAPSIYLFFNILESQFVTPQVLGRAMLLNPFVIFLAVVFGIWIWGAVGGFIAVPALLIVTVATESTAQAFADGSRKQAAVEPAAPAIGSLSDQSA